MSIYKENKDYKVTKNSIDIIQKKLNFLSYKSVFYIGYADKDLIISLKDKYKVSISDLFDKTNKNTAFWCEGMTEDGLYILNGTPIKLNIPKWAEDIPVMIEGIPEHEILILDIPRNGKLYTESYDKPAEIVFFRF